MAKTSETYSMVAVKHDVRFKLNHHQQALATRWGWWPTLSQVVDYLCDEAGVQEEVDDGEVAVQQEG